MPQLMVLFSCFVFFFNYYYWKTDADETPQRIDLISPAIMDNTLLMCTHLYRCKVHVQNLDCGVIGFVLCSNKLCFMFPAYTSPVALSIKDITVEGQIA